MFSTIYITYWCEIEHLFAWEWTRDSEDFLAIGGTVDILQCTEGGRYTSKACIDGSGINISITTTQLSAIITATLLGKNMNSIKYLQYLFTNLLK